MQTSTTPIPSIIAGESGVGKSSLVFRFVKNDFKEFYEATVGGKVRMMM